MAIAAEQVCVCVLESTDTGFNPARLNLMFLGDPASWTWCSCSSKSDIQCFHGNDVLLQPLPELQIGALNAGGINGIVHVLWIFQIYPCHCLTCKVWACLSVSVASCLTYLSASAVDRHLKKKIVIEIPGRVRWELAAFLVLFYLSPNVSTLCWKFW